MKSYRSILHLALFSAVVYVFFGIEPALAGAKSANFTAISTDIVHEIELLHQQAADHLIKNNFEAAVRAYSDILLLEPDDETAYTGLGQIYLITGQFKKAHEAFSNALEINPGNQVAFYGLKKIMDPDGLEGMTHQDEIYFEEPPAPEPLVTRQAPIAASKPVISVSPIKTQPVQSAATAQPAPRQSAQRVDKKRSMPDLGRLFKLFKKEPRLTPAKKLPPLQTNPSFRQFRTGFLHIQRIQMALKNTGYYQGPIHGFLDKKTRAALKGFQKQVGLPANGKATAQTWTQLHHWL